MQLASNNKVSLFWTTENYYGGEAAAFLGQTEYKERNLAAENRNRPKIKTAFPSNNGSFGNWELRPRSGRLLEHKKVTILENWEQLRPRSDRLLELKLFGFSDSRDATGIK